jgi:hypothetical protein
MDFSNSALYPDLPEGRSEERSERRERQEPSPKAFELSRGVLSDRIENSLHERAAIKDYMRKSSIKTRVDIANRVIWNSMAGNFPSN